MLPRRGSSLPDQTDGTKNKSDRDKEMGVDRTVKFFERFSSIKIDYEKKNRRTLQSYRNSDATFLRNDEEICTLLKNTLADDNLEEWYVELLCLIFPTTATRERPDSNALVTFLQKTFFFDSTTHSRLMKEALQKKIEARVLYLEVIEGKGLPAKDANGLSDPFCTLYLTSKDSSKRTKVAEKTLHPVWNESFKFGVKDAQTDFLKIEVWDHDPEERMRDKFKRFGEIKSPRAMGNLLREVSHGRHSAQEFIGTLEIPIKEISTQTIEKWCQLDNNQGELYLRMTLGVEKEKLDCIQGYRFLLQLLTIQELVKGVPMVPFHWDNKFEPWAGYLLRQLKSGWGLKTKDIVLAKWIAYTKVHHIFPISGRIFPPLVHEVFQSALNSEFNVQEISLALRSTGELIDFSADFIEKIHDFFPCMVTVSQLYYILKTLEILSKLIEELRSSCGTSLWNSCWMSATTSISAISIFNTVQNSIRSGATISFKKIVESVQSADSQCSASDSESNKALRIGQLLNADLQKGREVVDKDFKVIFGQNYHEITYGVYDTEYEKLVKPLIIQLGICLKLRCEPQPKDDKGKSSTLDSKDEVTEDLSDSSVTTNFLHLYFTLKKFADLAPVCSPSEGFRSNSNSGLIRGSFHNWFYPGIGYLLDLSGQMWMHWMKKAIEKDYKQEDTENNLYLYEGQLQISSSALDCVQIFTQQIQHFWTTLAWPDLDQFGILGEKVFRMLCGYSIFYAELVSENLLAYEAEKLKNSLSYQITEKLCRSVNNIDYVGIHTREIASKLLLPLEIFNGRVSVPADQTFIDRQTEIQKTGLMGVILGIFRSMGQKIQPEICKHLSKVSQVDEEKDGIIFHKLLAECLDFYGKNLDVLGKNLMTAYYENAMRDLWDETLSAVIDIMNLGVKNDKSWRYFTGLKTVLEILKGYLEAAFLQYNPSKSPTFTNNHKLVHIFDKLDVYGMPTAELKLCYYRKRFQRQEEIKGDSGSGLMSVRTLYQVAQETLVVEILNARNVPAADSNGLSDPYVGMKLIPIEHFPETGRHFTKVQKQTLYPLFDEIFSIKMEEKDFKKEGFLHFCIFDHDYILKDTWLGEAFIPFSNIFTSLSSSKDLHEFPQQLLPLTKPTEEDGQYLKEIMSHRTNDKEAVRFLAKQLAKCRLKTK